MNAEEYTILIKGMARHILTVGGTTRHEFAAWVRPILHGLHAGGFDKDKLNRMEKDAYKMFAKEQDRLAGYKFDWIARGALEGGITWRIQDGTLIWRKDKNGQYELKRRDCASTEEIRQWEELASREPYVTGKGQIVRLADIDRTGVNAAVNNVDAPKRFCEEARQNLISGSGEQAATVTA